MPSRLRPPSTGTRAKPVRSAAPPKPPPAPWRDPWAFASALATLPLLAHAWGAPLGEPAADDFDLLHHALFSPHRSLLDGGGSTAFWRPLSQQVYFGVLAPVMLAHPGLIAALHALALAAASLLLYRALRPSLPGALSCAAATFPLLAESERAFVSWPSHSADIGLLLFSALALHETARRRLWTALAAVLAALLCKETAVVTALLLPFMPGAALRERKERTRWAVGSWVLLGVWAAIYLAVRHHAHLALPHKLETDPRLLATPLPARLVWATLGSLRAIFSLRIPSSAVLAWVAVALVAIAGAATVLLIASPAARARLARSRAWWLWGLAWFACATLTLTPVYPYWAPYRAGFGSVGLGIALAGSLEAAHPALLGALVLLRLTTFALSPGPPALVSGAAPETGAFIDFERLVRLQRFVRETRTVLKRHYPRLPSGARVGGHLTPLLAEYALGGDQALQVWYRDTTLRWVRFVDLKAHLDLPLVTISEFQPGLRPQIALVDAQAMRAYLNGLAALGRNDASRGYELLNRADSLQRDSTARVFRGEVASERALALLKLNRWPEGESEAGRAAALWRDHDSIHYVFAWIDYAHGRLADALAEIDSTLGFRPDHTGALALRERIRRSLPNAPAAPPSSAP